MKIQYKAASIMTLFGVVIVLLLSWGYNKLNYRVVIKKEIKNIVNISEEVALYVESNIKEKATIAITLSSAPLIKDALLKSNHEFALLLGHKRNQKIDTYNQKWMKSTDSKDPFVLAHLTNPVARYLKYQQTLIPGEYGEIFLTNQYGVMIATTGKLTTLAHAHKYWWIACYNDGKGRVFLDDRGFDASVEGYVLGVVIPIMDKNEIIGIMKCNVNIIGLLTDVVHEFSLRHTSKMKIVRTGGLIVAERDVPPLSTQVNKVIVESLRQKVSGTTSISENNVNQLVAFSPIQITMGSEQFGFGGSKESIDHIKGNKGEGWHVVISLSEEDASKTIHETTRAIIIIGIIFTLLTAVVALFFGKWIARPIVKLAITAQAIGEGLLETRAEVSLKDEIGSLAKSLNKMAKNLQETMTSRNELISEVERRKEVENKLRLLSTTDELTGAYNRRAFNDSLHTNISRAKRYSESLSMIMLDIDRFKNINDSYGHDVGDIALKGLVRVVSESIRQEDILARWGGEEFTLLLPQTGKDSALQQAERLREKISAHAFPKIDHLTVSIGLTEFQNDDTISSFLKRVDNALYQAKERGRNIVIFG